MTAPTSTEPTAAEADRWPAWFAALAFVVAFSAALVLTLVLSGVATAITGTTDTDAPVLVIAGTVLQDAAFVLSAVWLARQVSRPRAADFGLRRAPVSLAVTATIAAGAVFYTVSAAYSALLRPDAEQETLDTLGVDQGLGFLIASGIIVVVLAPFAEEFLFRGFMYRCLRNRLRPLGAALVIGAVFGSIHYSGPETLELIPMLALLGFLFCMLYERTGSLYPAIALHAINNAIAFAVTADERGAVGIAAGTLAVAVALCFAMPARQSAAPAA